MTCTRLTFRASVLGIAALILTGAVAGLRAAEEGGGEPDLDVIKRVDDIPVQPTNIFKDDYITVEGKKGNIPVKVESWAVKEVFYAQRHPTYVTACDKRDKGNYVTAAKAFRLALESMGDKKWAAEYCNLGIGDAFFQNGNFSGYTDRQGFKYEVPSFYFREVLKANPKTRFLLEASVKLAISLAEEGKFDDAENAFKDAEATIKKYRDELGKVNPKYREFADKFIAMSTFGHARMLEKKAGEDPAKFKDYDFSPAISAYRSAQSMAESAKAPEVYSDAVDGELRVMVKMNDYAGAKARANGIIDKYKEKADSNLLGMLPGAYTVLGLANYNEGVDYIDNKKQVPQAMNSFAEARWNFLHVIVQFFDNDDYVAKAHFFAGMCYKRLKDQEPDGVEKAVRHFTSVVNDYPSSNFADLAKMELEKLGGAKPAPATAENTKTGEKKTGEAKTDDKKTDDKKTEEVKSK
ncbi:MAG: hypothetical protein HY291_04480 [Planctomycetes bacterium]|nr:hypothetical protein [Planctomycetota bacterium]